MRAPLASAEQPGPASSAATGVRAERVLPVYAARRVSAPAGYEQELISTT
jgi:hypothetical protein